MHYYDFSGSAKNYLTYWKDTISRIFIQFKPELARQIVGFSKAEFLMLANSDFLIVHNQDAKICMEGSSPIPGKTAFHLDMKTFLHGVSYVPHMFFQEGNVKHINYTNSLSNSVALGFVLSYLEIGESVCFLAQTDYYTTSSIAKQFEKLGAESLPFNNSFSYIFRHSGKKKSYQVSIPVPNKHDFVDAQIKRARLIKENDSTNKFSSRKHGSDRTQKAQGKRLFIDRFHAIGFYPEHAYSKFSPMGLIREKMGKINVQDC